MVGALMGLFDDDPDDAKKARDAALARVHANGGRWRDTALVALPYLIPGFVGTAEDIRIRLQLRGLEPPHHHNAWGDLIKAALKKRLIVPTGKRQPMRTRKSHARETPVYRVREGRADGS
jgi:hypothetical protein